MRPSILLWSLLASASSILAAPPGNEKTGAKVAPDALSGESGGDAGDHTTFNGIKVPPMKDILGPEFQSTIKDGYW